MRTFIKCVKCSEHRIFMMAQEVAYMLYCVSAMKCDVTSGHPQGDAGDPGEHGSKGPKGDAGPQGGAGLRVSELLRFYLSTILLPLLYSAVVPDLGGLHPAVSLVCDVFFLLQTCCSNCVLRVRDMTLIPWGII